MASIAQPTGEIIVKRGRGYRLTYAPASNTYCLDHRLNDADRDRVWRRFIAQRRRRDEQARIAARARHLHAASVRQLARRRGRTSRRVVRVVARVARGACKAVGDPDGPAEPPGRRRAAIGGAP